MKTYSKSGIRDFASLLKDNLFKTKRKAINAYNMFMKINKDIYSYLGYYLENSLILDIGCGQRFPYTYLFSNKNKVIGLDLDIILFEHSIRNYKTIIKENGFNRFFKTFLRSILFDRKYFQILSSLNKNLPKQRKFKIVKMNAENLKFKNDSFDFILSIHSFEHIQNIEKVIIEIKRVLKKGGSFYIAIDFYSKYFGGHKFDTKNPWEHLLDKNFKPNVYVNRLTVEEYKKLFNKYFKDINFICRENRFMKQYLTKDIKKLLVEYSELELLMEPMIVIGRK